MTRDEALKLQPGDVVLVRARVSEVDPEAQWAVQVATEADLLWVKSEDIHSLAPPPPPEPLKVGDWVITPGGSHAHILAVNDAYAWLRVVKGYYLTEALSDLTRKATP